MSTASFAVWEHGARFVHPARSHQIVKQVGGQEGAEVHGDIREGKPLAAGVRAYVGRNREHGGNDQPEVSFFLGGSAWRKAVSANAFASVTAPGGMQANGGLGHERPAQWMIARCEVEGPPTQVGGSSRIGRVQRVGGLREGRDRDLRLPARRSLLAGPPPRAASRPGR